MNDGNWTTRMAMDLDSLRADQATNDRLAKLAIDSQRRLVLTR